MPTAQQLGEGELAFNLADRKIFARFGDVVQDITDRYTREEINNALSGKANADDLAAVATSGRYADLSGTPDLGTAAAQNTTAFDAAGTASKALETHAQADDPHSQYVKKETGKGLSSNDYTTVDRERVAALGSMASRDIHAAQRAPTSSDGANGDIWFQY